MRINQNEIVEEVLEHIRQNGGDITEWCVGTAQDEPGQESQQQAGEAGFLFRQAYTPYAADGVIENLKALGLHHDPPSPPAALCSCIIPWLSCPPRRAT